MQKYNGIQNSINLNFDIFPTKMNKQKLLNIPKNAKLTTEQNTVIHIMSIIKDDLLSTKQKSKCELQIKNIFNIYAIYKASFSNDAICNYLTQCEYIYRFNALLLNDIERLNHLWSQMEFLIPFHKFSKMDISKLISTGAIPFIWYMLYLNCKHLQLKLIDEVPNLKDCIINDKLVCNTDMFYTIDCIYINKNSSIVGDYYLLTSNEYIVARYEKYKDNEKYIKGASNDMIIRILQNSDKLSKELMKCIYNSEYLCIYYLACVSSDHSEYNNIFMKLFGIHINHGNFSSKFLNDILKGNSTCLQNLIYIFLVYFTKKIKSSEDIINCCKICKYVQNNNLYTFKNKIINHLIKHNINEHLFYELYACIFGIKEYEDNNILFPKSILGLNEGIIRNTESIIDCADFDIVRITFKDYDYLQKYIYDIKFE